MAEGALRELITLFQLGVDAEELEKGEKKLQGFLGRVRKVGEVVAEAFAVHLVKDFFEEQIEGAAHVKDLSDRLGIEASKLKQLSIVAASAGVDIDGTAQMLGHLQKNLGDAETKGGEAAAAFQRLGINAKEAAKKDLPDLLGDVAEGLQKLPDQNARAAAAMAIFGREGRALLPILSQGREGIKGMTEEARELAGGLGDDFYEDAKKAREEGERFGIAMQTIKAKITIAAMPAIMGLLGILKKGALGVIDFTKRTNVLKEAVIILSGAAGLKLVKTLREVSKALGLVKATAGATIKSLLGFLGPVAIAALLYFVFDEFFTLMQGGDTIIGRTLNDLLDDTNASTAAGLLLKDAWTDAKETMSQFGHVLKGAVLGPLLGIVRIVIGLGKALYLLAAASGGADVSWAEFSASIKETGDAVSKTVADMKAELGKARDEFNAPDAYQKRLDQLRAGLTPKQLLSADPKLLAGLPPEAQKRLLAFQGAAKESTQGTSAAAQARGRAYLAKLHAQSEPHVVTVPRAHGGGGAAAAGAPTVVQHNAFTTTVHTSSDQPRAVGEATGAGVATAAQKATNNALVGRRKL